MWFIWVFQPEMQEKKIKNQKLENQSKRRCGLQDSGAAAVGGQICMVSQEINYLIRGWVGQKKGNYKEREDTIFVLYKICCHAFQCRSDTNVNEEGLTQASFTKALLYLVMNRVVFQSWNKHPENLNRRAKLCWFYRINKTIRLALCIIYLECLHGFSHCVLSILTFWTSQHPIMQISYEPLLRSAFLWQVRPVKLGLMFIKVKQTAASQRQSGAFLRCTIWTGMKPGNYLVFWADFCVEESLLSGELCVCMHFFQCKCFEFFASRFIILLEILISDF